MLIQGKSAQSDFHCGMPTAGFLLSPPMAGMENPFLLCYNHRVHSVSGEAREEVGEGWTVECIMLTIYLKMNWKAETGMGKRDALDRHWVLMQASCRKEATLFFGSGTVCVVEGDPIEDSWLGGQSGWCIGVEGREFVHSSEHLGQMAVRDWRQHWTGHSRNRKEDYWGSNQDQQ